MPTPVRATRWWSWPIAARTGRRRSLAGSAPSVLERGPEEEPGRAAARQAGLEHARALEWDAVVMLDADSVIAPGFFDACEQALAPGADAVQARSESSRGRTLATEASWPRSPCRASRSRAAATASGSRCGSAAPGWRSGGRWRSRTASGPPPPRISSSPST